MHCWAVTPSQALFGVLIHCLDQLCMTCKVDRNLLVVTAATSSCRRQPADNGSSDCLRNGLRRFILRKVAHAFQSRHDSVFKLFACQIQNVLPRHWVIKAPYEVQRPRPL